jgi:hypothetical protein
VGEPTPSAHALLQGTHTAQPNRAHEGVANSASWMVHGGKSLEASPNCFPPNAPHSCGYGLIPRLTMLRTAHLNTNLSVPCPAFGVTCTAQFPHYTLSPGGGGVACTPVVQRVTRRDVAVDDTNMFTGTSGAPQLELKAQSRTRLSLHASRLRKGGGGGGQGPFLLLSLLNYHLQAHSGYGCLPQGSKQNCLEPP